MSERREPGLGDLSPTPRKPAAKRPVQPNSAAPRPASAQRPGRSPAKPAKVQAAGGSKLATVLAIIAIIATSAVGFLLYQNQQLQAQTLTQLATQQTQIAERIDRVMADLQNNGVATSESQEALIEQDEFLLTEIRKLWDLSNKRNRVNIETLEADVATLSSNAQALASQVAVLNELPARIDSQLEERVAGIQQSLATELASQSAQQQGALNTVQAQLNALPDAKLLANVSAQQQTAQAQVLELRLAVETLDEQIAALSAAAGGDMSLSQWISVMDASRIELSQRISALQIQLESP